MTTTSTTKLIDHSLSAAQQIIQECAHIIDDEPYSPSASSCHDAHQPEPPPYINNTEGTRLCGLEGVEGPLIELLHRQASRILQLYYTSKGSTSSSGEGDAGSGSSNDDADFIKTTGTKEERINAISLVKRRLELLTKTAYGKFYAYLYKEVPSCWRQLYTDAAVLKFAGLVLLEFEVEGDEGLKEEDDEKEKGKRVKREQLVDEMVKTLDLSLILAGAVGESRGRRWVDEAFGLLEDVLEDMNLLATTSGGEKKDDDGQEGERPQKKRRLSPSSDAKDEVSGQYSESWKNTPSFSTREPFTPPVKKSIPRVSADSFSIEEFQSHFTKLRTDGGPGPAPIVITGLVDHWPALTTHPWNKPAYFLSRTLSGRRLVPVEIGRSYVDEGWGQKIISFDEFLSKYIDSSTPVTSCLTQQPQSSTSSQLPEQDNEKNQIAYLAQHPLFLQLPRLRADILTPDLCYTAPPLHPTDPSQDQPEVDSPQLNAWFGPPGTITPLHTDPYHNLLVQVAGRKYVRLYGPEKTRKMRPRGKEGGVEMGNTSAVDLGVLEGWDEPQGDRERKEGGHEEQGEEEGGNEEVEGEEENGEVQAREAGKGREEGEGKNGNKGEEEKVKKGWEEDFKKVSFVDCILEPGDTLYIPIGWWHYVRGLSVSFSVSFWWN